MDLNDPRRALSSWLPHLLLLAVVAATAWWLLAVVAPLRDPLLLAASIALLAWPMLVAPLEGAFARRWPKLPGEARRALVAGLATVLLVAAAALALFILLWALAGRLSTLADLALGLFGHDAARSHAGIERVVARADKVLSFFPAIPVGAAQVRAALESVLLPGAIGPEMLRLLYTGTGGFLAQAALTLLALFYLLAQGPQVVRVLAAYLPLSDAQRGDLARRFARIAAHLWLGVAARAAVQGAALGVVAWLVGGFNPVLVGVVAAVVGLLPLVGHAIVWMPLAAALAHKGLPYSAAGMAVGGLAASLLVELLWRRVAARLGTDALWLGFLTFLGLVGGMLSFGPRGLVLGPAAVLAASTVASFLPPLYGMRALEEQTAEAGKDDTP